MAGVLYPSWSGIVCLLTILYMCAAATLVDIPPTFHSVHVINETIHEDANRGILTTLYLKVEGRNLQNNMKVRATTHKSSCSEKKNMLGDDNTVFSMVWSNSTTCFMTTSVRLKEGIDKIDFYMCVKSVHRTRTSEDKSRSGSGFLSTLEPSSEVVKWIHQGESVVFRTKKEHLLYAETADLQKPSVAEAGPVANAHSSDWTVLSDDPVPVDPLFPVVSKVKVYGFKLEDSEKPVDIAESGIPELLVGTSGVLRLFGSGWTNHTKFVLTDENLEEGAICEYPIGVNQEFEQPIQESATSALLYLQMPEVGKPGTSYFLCTKEAVDGQTASHWVHLGNQPYLQVRTYQKLLPLWLQLLIIVTCLSFSSLFSGLNLGLMSLDRTDLRIICNTGTESERRYARTILPVREHGNYLLCSILLGNVMVNSTFTILLDDMTSGLVAVVVSTLLIVVCGEITPQAVCSRHGLAIGAKTIHITKVVMVLTFPLAYPISKILDWALGEEIGAVYTRERLKELVKLTTEFNDLEKDEVNIISGALELRRKMVADVMTKLEDAFMLSYDAILDFETVSEIMKSGFSRIPVYEGNRKNIITVLYIKDLALVDPDDNTPLKTLCQFYQNPCYFVFEDTTLDVLFKQFKEGIKGHMAFVHRVNNEGEGDPFYETVGLITLEDVIEELIQAEIMDETDVWTDNRTKNRRSQNRSMKKDFTSFAERSENQRIHISPQLTLATFQFLSTLDAFKPESISETILSRLLKQDIIYQVKVKNREKSKDDPHTMIYQQGKSADYFILILEGRVEVTMGRENLVFESGPFTYFGMQALTQNVGVGEPKLAESPTAQSAQPLGSLQSVNLESMLRYTFVPDYSVRAVADTYYLRIKRSFYLAAKRATLMERSKKEESNAGDNFEDEVEKLLHTYDDDTRSQGSPDITRTQSQRGTPGQTSPNSVLNNGSLLTTSEPALVSPSRTPPKSADADERVTLLRSAES
ncbi:unextended protein isoform X2 [Homalodisca vitripennis]|uniref:unextended protein isoform X2 n=1 Tax=Homalodisca vitripennis TaxID=197043 RepID=UPI001EEAB7F4|nr:unextended protein isoform X2 [Homalodisca vitripennis]